MTRPSHRSASKVGAGGSLALALMYSVGCGGRLPAADAATVDAATPDARTDAVVVDAAPKDSGPTVDADAETADAGPNPNVVQLPPSGMTAISGFTNAGLTIAYSDSRDSSDNMGDVFYYELISFSEHRVTYRSGEQVFPDIVGSDLVYCDYGFSIPAQELYRSELFVYDLADATEVQITNSSNIKSQPKINDRYILYRENAGCSSTFEVNLTLMSRATGDATVVSECEQNPETHSLSDRWAAWTARPLPNLGNKKVHVMDLETGVITVISPEASGQQFFPHTDVDHVIWEDSRDGQREIYLHTFSTGDEECLTPDGWEQGWPTLRNGLAAWCDYQYSQQYGEYAPCDVVVYELLTRTQRRVTATSDRWMPRFVDSGWILYGQSIWQSGSFKLYAHDLVNDGILTPDGHVVP